MVSSGYLKVNPNGSIEITDKYIKYTAQKEIHQPSWWFFIFGR